MFYSTMKLYDGFGAQYQRTIQTYIYCKIHNYNFVYDYLKNVEHNYDNDNEYIFKLEKLINLKNNILNIDESMKVEHLDFGSTVREYFENNIDYCCETEHMKFIKECFWENKNRNYFNNNKINIAVQIRRENSHDLSVGGAGSRTTTPNSYYLNIMNNIREQYKNSEKQLLFHIYSQGDKNQFEDFNNDDVELYLNYDVIETFMGMVTAEKLIISPSSFSYVAALLSDGEIYYKPFWHNPKKNWIICG